MIKSLKDARITDALPRIVAGQDWVIALSKALGVQHEQTLQFIDDSQIYTNLDNVSEDILDTLAINWKIDWYDTDYSLEQKRRIIKTAIPVRRLMGTPYATRIQADAIYPGTQLEEWFDYGGEAGTFRLYVDISDTSEDALMYDYDIDELERRLTSAKRWSAQLESFSYMIKHGIKIGHAISYWKYKALECGIYRCGTYWTTSTLGYSEDGSITIPTTIDGYVYELNETGTLPEISTKGYSTCGSLECGTTVQAYISESDESGQEYSGTLYETATKGYSTTGTVDYSTEVEAVSVTLLESGLYYSGSLE